MYRLYLIFCCYFFFAWSLKQMLLSRTLYMYNLDYRLNVFCMFLSFHYTKRYFPNFYTLTHSLTPSHTHTHKDTPFIPNSGIPALFHGYIFSLSPLRSSISRAHCPSIIDISVVRIVEGAWAVNMYLWFGV